MGVADGVILGISVSSGVGVCVGGTKVSVGVNVGNAVGML